MDSTHSKHDRPTPTLGLALLLTLNLSGCATEEIPDSSPDFGDSVRHTIALQTGGYSRPTGMDAVKAENALREYQKDVAKPEQVKQDLIIRVGQ